MARWIISIEAEDGARSSWGYWRDFTTPERLAERLRSGSSAYGNRDGAPYRVAVENIERWPGLRAAYRELTGEELPR